MTTVFIGIGSNVGDRVAFCRRAVRELEQVDGVAVEAVSSLYETTPVGGPPQRSYVNAVVRIATDLGPTPVLAICKDIERRLGREPTEMRWGPRVVDLDILLYDEDKVSEPELEIPHPRLKERLFALLPLLEIAPDATDPWGERLADWVSEAEGSVELLESF